MREHKFCGKRIDNGEWVSGCLVELDFHDSHDYVEESQIVLQNGHTYTVIPESVGEYNGLWDKHESEICEGDIVQYPDGSGRQEVIFKDGCFEIKENEYNNWELREIIGKKFDNPELLKVDNGK